MNHMNLTDEVDTLSINQRWMLDLGLRANHATLFFLSNGKLWSTAGWARNRTLLAKLLLDAYYYWPIQ